MDKMLNSKQEKETIYEIYRGCRLCGGGAGYKMPIIQNIIDLEDSDVELRQKIRECVQIEVHQDDKMPPLICELCVDKVNDFYEFLDMCRQTNKKTRLRLGLPPQSMPRGAPDAGDCILGLTEPVFVEDSDGDGQPLAKQKKTKIKKEPGLKEVVKKEVEPGKKVKDVKKESKKEVKKEPIHEPVVRFEHEVLHEGRSSRHSKRPRTPPRVTRLSRANKDDEEAFSSLKEKTESPKVTPRPILKRESSNSSNSSRRGSKTIEGSESDDSSTSRKRPKDKQQVKFETPSKKVRITIKPPQLPGQKTSAKPSPKPVKRAPTPPPKEDYNCTICGAENKSSQGRSNHLKIHTVGFTSHKLACNPCGEWFSTADEVNSHHKRHRSISFPYSCRNCYSDFKRISSYDEHLQNKECILTNEVPDMKCETCWQMFPTHNLLDSHKCLGEDHRPGGKCGKCNRSYALLKNLKKHESTCTARKKGQPIVDEEVLKKLLPMQVRISRCDSVLKNGRNKHCDTSNLPTDFGLDPACFYPYLGLVRIKSEFKGMVNIVEDFKEFSPEDYIHWDSTDDESDEEITCSEALNSVLKKKKVESLTALCLKSIFSKKLLGKVPRKRRKFKPEKVFDYLNDDVKMDLDSIINNLGDDEIDCKKDVDNNDSSFKFDSVVNNNSANDNNDSSSKRNSGENNDLSLPKVNGDTDVSNDKNNHGEINAFKPTASEKDNLSVTSKSDKNCQGNPGEVPKLDLLKENDSQGSALSENSSSNRNLDSKNGDLDLKGNNVENNDSVHDNTNNDSVNNDTSNSSCNSKITLSDILPKSTENEVTVSSINNFSFDF